MIQKSIAKVTDIQPHGSAVLATGNRSAPAKVASKSATAAVVKSSSHHLLHHSTKMAPCMEEQDQSLEPELMAFQEAASSFHGTASRSTEMCSMTASMEASLTASSTSSSSRFMVASTSNFSDMDEVKY